MRFRLAAWLGLSAPMVWAQSVVSPRPEPGDVGRYQVLAVEGADLSVKIDSMTGSTWRLCPSEKRSGPNLRWCPMSSKSQLPPGPIRRYTLHADAAAKSPNLFMLDTVSGRSWLMCVSPQLEKQFGWCSLDE